MTTPHRRHTDAWHRRWGRLVFAPLTDRPGYELSLTKALAIFYSLLVWHSVEEKHVVSGTILTLAIASYAVAFGKSTFTFFLTRYEMKQSLAATTSASVNLSRADTNAHTVTETINRQITERRNADDGYEATP